MIKKTLFIFTILFLNFLFTNKTITAKEYCNIFEDNKLKETIEMPFYFYTITQEIDLTTSMPTFNHNYTKQLIDSQTKCESIDVIVHFPLDPTNNIIKIYDYTKDPYSDSIYAGIIFQNAKLTKDKSKINGYSTIIDEEPPYFNGYKEYYKTNIDNPINLNILLATISAYDKRDGNITNKITIEYSDYENNLKKAGTYSTILSVIDNANNKTSITFYIEIIDSTPPTITGINTYTSHLSSPLKIEEIKNNLKATDNTQIDLTSQIYTCEDYYSQNKNLTGIYNIFFCVYDKANNLSSPYEVKIEVKDDIAPVIEGLNYYTSKLSSPITVKEISYSLTAIDNGIDVSNSIFISNDYYTNYQNTLGEKNIYFQAMDTANNISKPFKVTINLIDDIPPQIFGLNTYTSYLSSPLSLTYLKQQLTVLDNFEGNISNNLEIIEDSYSNNINKKGTYSITLKALDSSNNISETFKINITNIDDIPPSITGPSNLTYSINNKPSLSNILSQYKAEDNIDQNLKITVSDDSYSSSLTTGTYYLNLNSTDSSNNTNIPFNIKIDIVDIILNLNELSLYLPTNKLLTIQQINKLINLNENYTILENTYTPNYNKEGNYKIQYALENETKIALNITTFIQKEEQITKVKIQKKETFLTKMKSFFSKTTKKIKNLFKKIKFISIFPKF